ncbi:MAG TPA: flagellar basal body M-ring protein FliF [Gammaproteobacteria bacterium]|nr:flagellar basal body M-ring protein FliF [Gammaproteobacteria bacterium]
MAQDTQTNKYLAAVQGFGRLSMVRQVGLLIGFAASVAIGVSLALWSQEPGYRLLYSGLNDQDVLAVTQALEQAGIPYQLSTDSGTVQVPGESVHQARLKLAAQGLPKGAGVGFELLDKEQGFGVSQFMENARYQRALEGELARSITSFNSVQSARVHLAIPKRTAFLRDRHKKDPSASVMVNLYPGRRLDEGQVAAIVHLVAASIPELSTGGVTVVDQSGKLLTAPESSAEMKLSSTQFDYRKRLEEYYIKRIEAILSPIVGVDGVRAQVNAEVDFSIIEQTRESFNPDLPAIRSEQTFEESSVGSPPPVGIPGALSNQPPVAGDGEAAPGQASGEQTKNSSRRVTRNYELDKTISHTRLPTGQVRRLSVAVVVDNRKRVDEEGAVVSEPRSAEELARIQALVKQAVGFSAARGDSLNVINTAFAPPAGVEEIPQPSLWDDPLLWDALKQLMAGIGVLALLFGVLKPVLKNLSQPPPEAAQPPLLTAGGEGAAAGEVLAEDQVSLGGAPGAGGQLPSPSQYEERLETVKTLAAEDPKRVAQVVKNWVSDDG